jgi:hypothetical protein
MTPYWLAYILPVFFSLNSFHRRHSSLIWMILFVSFVIFSGLRHEVGGDWGAYIRRYNDAQFYPFWEYLFRWDPGYMFLNWISYQMDGSVYLVNVMSALFFISCLIVFCRAQPLPFLAFSVAMPYLIAVISMGYTRQGIALGFAMLGLKYLSDGGVKRYLVFIVIGAFFHKSAVILLPLVIFYHHRGFVGRLLGVGGFSLIMGYLFLVDYYDAFWVNYVDSQMRSDGGLIRLLMNFLPSLLFFIYYRRIKQAWPDYRIWFVLAIATMVMLPLVGFASTAVDRVALYLIPIQLVVFSRLPMFFSITSGRVAVIRIIVAYYALVLFVWFNFATHARYWLPYQNYITLDLF